MPLPATVEDPSTQKNFDWITDHLVAGRGSPNGVVRAAPGCLYLNEDGGVGATLWVKETGTGTTGWVAK